MNERDAKYVSEEEAARLWQRAAQLQAEAAQRAESEARDAEHATFDDGDSTEGYELTHVKSAAADAGIAEEFVDAALADLHAERALPVRKGPRSFTRRFLGDPPDAITVRRVVNASAAEVMSAMEEILPNAPYRLSLRDRQGDPFRGGVLIFDIVGAGFGVTEGFAGEASWADFRQVYVSLRPIPGEPPACEITLRSPVAWAQALNVGIGTVFSGMAGFGGFVVGSVLAGFTLGTFGLGPVAAAVAAGLAAGGSLAGAGGGFQGFRALYDYSIRRGERALDGLLGAVAVKAEGGWGFTPDESFSPAETPPALEP